MLEIVYVLTNEAMPGLIKIGRTSGDLAVRVKALYQNPGVPLPFEVFYACEVANAAFVERQLHEAFGDHRVSQKREFFRLAPERASAALSLAKIKEIKLGDEIFETPEEKAEVEAAKRRSRFRFSMIGVLPGTELQLYKDPTIICTTVDDTNRVNFKGDVTSLSDAALQAHEALGDEWAAISGPWAWAFQGKRLDEIRKEIEDSSD
jgi:hypothetical protein